jgi:hypothetical protein
MAPTCSQVIQRWQDNEQHELEMMGINQLLKKPKLLQWFNTLPKICANVGERENA